jgi:DNA-binding transcriptional LysR family regulator
MAFLAEVVVEGGVNRGEFLECHHLPKPVRRPLPSSERQARILSPIEVDDMAMLRLLARERESITLAPPIVVRDELESWVLVEHCRIPQLTESFYAIVQNHRFPNQLLGELLARYSQPNPAAL